MSYSCAIEEIKEGSDIVFCMDILCGYDPFYVLPSCPLPFLGLLAACVMVLICRDRFHDWTLIWLSGMSVYIHTTGVVIRGKRKTCIVWSGFYFSYLDLF